MSSDYSPFPQGPPIIHRDEPVADKPAPDPEQPEEDEPPADTAQETDDDSDD